MIRFAMSVTAGKPEATILDGLDCFIDGISARVTVTIRPSDSSMLIFHQVRVHDPRGRLITTVECLLRYATRE